MQAWVLGLGINVDADHIMGMENFLDAVRSWGMPWSEEGICRTADYLYRLHHEKYFATSLQIPCILDGKEGTLVCISTAASTGRMRENMDTESRGGIICDPHWTLYDTYWFQGLAPLNFVGMRHVLHNGQQLPENLGMLVAKLSLERGIRDWQKRFLVCSHMEYAYGLRLFIHEALGCKVWVEMTFGNSMQAYNTLDMYVSMFSFGIQPPRESAWYLINHHDNPLYRPEWRPEDFWRCMNANMVGMGQRETVSEWTLVHNARVQEQIPHAFRYIAPGMTPPSRM